MRIEPIFLASVLAMGCAGERNVREGDAAPYKAVLVFSWLGKESAPSGQRTVLISAPQLATATTLDGSDEALTKEVSEPPIGLSRADVEGRILNGLIEERVFSSCVPATWATMGEVARKEKADLIVLLRLGTLVKYHENEQRTIPGLAVLDTFLWLCTGIGGWWTGDHEFPTSSDVEVSWSRPEAPEAPLKVVPEPAGIRDIPTDFARGELLSSGDCRLSFWQRAKPWRYPWPYLMTILVPPPLVPLQDHREVDESLADQALENIQRELARKLKGGYIGSAGSPFRFQIREPANWGVAREDPVKLRYSYRHEQQSSEDFLASGFSRHSIEVQNEPGSDYHRVYEYNEDQLKDINSKIRREEMVELERVIPALRPGVTLIRFVAYTNMGGKCITNTVALQHP